MSRVRYPVKCPTCHAPAHEHCRTTPLSKHPGRVTDTHQARMAYRGYVGDPPPLEPMPCRCSTYWTGVTPNAGLSAYAIKFGGNEYPRDPSDLCRCLYVSPSAPTHMRKRSPEWAVLVDNWDELSALLREEHRTGAGPKTYRRMKELFAEARAVPA